jgi:hypothetical protein
MRYDLDLKLKKVNYTQSKNDLINLANLSITKKTLHHK